MSNLIKIFFGSIFPKFFIFVLNVLIARSLSITEFGFYSFVKSFYNYFETTVSSALNPFAIARLVNGDYSKAQFFGLYFIYGITSAFLAITFFILSNSSIDYTVVAVLFGGVFGSILNAYFYVVLINDQRGLVILLSTFFAAVFLLFTVYLLPVSTAIFAIILALSFNVIDLLFKLVYFLRETKYEAFKISFSVKKLPIKPSFVLMVALMINGGVFLFQRYMLAEQVNGFQQMGYLEILMQLYAFLTIILTALANGLMREDRLLIYGATFKGMDVLAVVCGSVSVLYGGLIHTFESQISALYKIDMPIDAINVLCLMVVTYAFAFFSVRLLIMKERQKFNLLSTLISSVMCFSTYIFMDVSALAIIISYCMFYFFMGVINISLLRLYQEGKV